MKINLLLPFQIIYYGLFYLIFQVLKDVYARARLIRFYEYSLRLVAGGASASKIFSENERNKLRNAGILRYMNLQWVISDEAKKHLGLT